MRINLEECVACELLIGSGVRCFSSLYGATTKHILCEHCSGIEEDAIHKEGTNNIPKLLKRYRNTKEPKLQTSQETTT